MFKVRLTKEFKFEAAHALWNYDGLCQHIHGHSYKLFVTIIGSPSTDVTNPKFGMLMDFGDLKKIVNQQIIEDLDHSLMFYKLAVNHLKFMENVPQMFDKVHVLDYQPTCENLVFHFSEKLKKHLPKHIKLFSIKLYETATSFAEWYQEDEIKL